MLMPFTSHRSSRGRLASPSAFTRRRCWRGTRLGATLRCNRPRSGDIRERRPKAAVPPPRPGLGFGSGQIARKERVDQCVRTLLLEHEIGAKVPFAPEAGFLQDALRGEDRKSVV